MQYKSLKEARMAASNQGHSLPQCTQFPIRFKDETIYMQPEKMEYSNGYPKLNAEKYIREHHPDKLQEYLDALNIRKQQLKYIDDFLGSSYPLR